MIFIKYDLDNRVNYVHYMPFDEKHGLHKTNTELLSEGAIVNEIPTLDTNHPIEHIYDKKTNTVYCKIISDYKEQVTLEEQAIKISNLETENKELKAGQTSQDIMIQSTQDAVDFLLLSSVTDTPIMAKNINTNLEGVSTMANYIALRIIQKGEIYEKSGQDYYVTFMTHNTYTKYKSEIDTILKATENENLIVDLSKKNF